MALVAFAGEALRADVHAVVVGGGHDVQVVLGEAHGQLVELVLSVDGDGDVVPDLARPGGGALGKQLVVAEPARGLMPGERLVVQLVVAQAFAVAVAGGVDAGELFYAERAARGDGYLIFLGYHAAVDDDEAGLLARLAVHGEGEGGVEYKVDLRLSGGLAVLHVAALEEALVALGEVLAAGIRHAPVDAAGNVEQGLAVEGPDAELLADDVQPLHGHEAAEAELIAPAVRGLPDDLADGFAGFEVQGPVVVLHRAGEQAEALPVELYLQPGDVGRVWQLGDLVVVELVESAGHEEVALFAGVEFVRGVAKAEIAVALAHDGFALAQVFGLEAALRDYPVFRPRVVHAHFVVLL